VDDGHAGAHRSSQAHSLRSEAPGAECGNIMGRKKLYECPSPGCGKVFLSFQSIKEHRKEHGGTRYLCSFEGCGKRFKWRSSLASHKKSHLDEVEEPPTDTTVERLVVEQLSPRGRSESSMLDTGSVDGSQASLMSSDASIFDIGNSLLDEPSYDLSWSRKRASALEVSTWQPAVSPSDHLFLLTCDQLSPLCAWDR